MGDYWDREWARRIQDDGSVKMNTHKVDIILNKLWSMPELIRMRKLEVGCGPALHVARLASRCREWAENYIGIDPSTVAIETAQKHVRAYQMSVFDLPASPLVAKSVQAVFLFDVIEHIEDHDKLADSLNKVVDDRFCVLINVPLYRSKLEENGGFERLVDVEDVKRLLRQLGVTQFHHEVYGIGGYPYLWVQGGVV